jgi:hypothetical protein
MFDTMREKICFWIAPEIKEDLDHYWKENDKQRLIITELMRENKRLKEESKIDASRKLLGGVAYDMNVKGNYLSELSEKEIKDFNRWGWELATSHWWEYLVSWTLNSQATETIATIPYDRDKSLFGSGRIDGIIALRDEVDARKSAHDATGVTPEPFDPDMIIQ